MVLIICATDREDVRNRWFEGLAGHRQVREVQDKDALMAELGRGEGQLVLLHLGLPGLGAEGVKEVRAAHGDIPLFCFADAPDNREGLMLLQLGVSGYANSYMNPALLARAVDVVESGQVWLGQRLMQALINSMANGGAGEALREAPELQRLTERERQIVSVLAEGASNKIIARRLDITERTVKAHLTSIFEKTGTHDRLELALLVQGRKSSTAPLNA